MLICQCNQETNGLQIKQLIIFPLIIASDFGCFTRGRLHFYGTKRRITAAKPLVQQLTYRQYVGFWSLAAFPCHSSHCCHKNNSFQNPRRIALSKPLVQQLMYHLYIRVAVQGAFSCSSSVLSYKNNIAIKRAIDCVNARSLRISIDR